MDKLHSRKNKKSELGAAASMYVCYAAMRTASRTSDYHKRLQLPHQRSPPIQGNDIYAEVICVSKSIRFVYCRSVCVMMCSTFNLSSLIFPHSPHFYLLIYREPGSLHAAHISIGYCSTDIYHQHISISIVGYMITSQ